MAARLSRLLVALALSAGAMLPSPAAAAVVRLTASQQSAASVVPARGAAPAYARSYFGARYYRADLGRFTTIDPVYTWSENLVDPQRWNRYAYVRNNPLKFVDPDGKNPVLVVLGIAWAAYEIGSSIYDAYATYQTLRDPKASTTEKLTTGGLFVAGMLPGVPGGAASVERAAIRHADDVVDATRLVARTELHHAWPKYLGGPGKQVLAELPENLNHEFHAGFDKLLPRQLGAEHYRKLTPTQQAEQFDLLRRYIEAFDKKHKTELWDALKAVAK
jgi:RHS repeat-associated protein